METKLEQDLFASAPMLYARKDLPGTLSLMCYGFDCPDSWFKTIKGLSAKLEAMNKQLAEGGSLFRIEADQVKEKFGCLRFYYSIADHDSEWKPAGGFVSVDALDDAASDAIAAAEDESEGICAECGAPATQVTRGWIIHLCDKCYAAYYNHAGHPWRPGRQQSIS